MDERSNKHPRFLNFIFSAMFAAVWSAPAQAVIGLDLTYAKLDVEAEDAEGSAEDIGETKDFGVHGHIAIDDQRIFSIGAFARNRTFQMDGADDWEIGGFTGGPEIKIQLTGDRITPFVRAGAVFGTYEMDYSSSSIIGDIELSSDWDVRGYSAAVGLHAAASNQMGVTVEYMQAEETLTLKNESVKINGEDASEEIESDDEPAELAYNGLMVGLSFDF